MSRPDSTEGQGVAGVQVDTELLKQAGGQLRAVASASASAEGRVRAAERRAAAKEAKRLGRDGE